MTSSDYSAGNSGEHPIAGDTAVTRALEAVWSIICREGLEYARPHALRSQLRRVTTEARAASIPPERLLWMMKQSWRGLPEVRKVDRLELASDLLAQVVTICIEEYFA